MSSPSGPSAGGQVSRMRTSVLSDPLPSLMGYPPLNRLQHSNTPGKVLRKQLVRVLERSVGATFGMFQHLDRWIQHPLPSNSGSNTLIPLVRHSFLGSVGVLGRILGGSRRGILSPGLDRP